MMDSNHSIVAVVDVQSKLLGGVHESDELVKNCSWLVRLAGLMEVPVIGSEQYPDGLGHTEESLRALIGPDHIYGKHAFACIADPEFEKAFEAHGRTQVILCGMESQACIMQSALQLLKRGLEVFVVTDAISARSPNDTNISMRRMEQAGAQLVTREMVGFEWLRGSDTPEFKAFSKEFLQ